MSSTGQSQSSDSSCQTTHGVALNIATFFVLSIFCHAATLHAAPGQFRRVTFARGLGMIFSPVTAGLYSLMSLGRMGVAWISIAARTIELIARIMAPEDASETENTSEKRRKTLPNIHAVTDAEVVESPSTISLGPVLKRTMSAPVSPPSPPISKSNGAEKPNRKDSQPPSPEEMLQRSPIQSFMNLTTLVTQREALRQNSQSTKFDVRQELPHRLHTRAVIAGAVGIHVPRCFRQLLRDRGWDSLSRGQFREITTEYSRVPESDPAFEGLYQYILPPNALLLDKNLRLYPGSMFREACAGLLQLGFGLYQMISADARYSVNRDGMASPYLIVLPYLGMAAVNTVINLLDPPYAAVTVLDISAAAREAIFPPQRPFFGGPTTKMSGYFRADHYPPNKSITLRLPDRGEKGTGNGTTTSTFKIDEEKSSSPMPLVQSPGPSESPSPSGPNFSPSGKGTWDEFVDWLTFAYPKRVDVAPVDRLYRTAWLSHSIIIVEFIYTTICALLIPLVLLAVVGGWTQFQSSDRGVSLVFNLLAIFGIPVVQFLLYTHYRLVRMMKELRARKDLGTFYWPPGTVNAPPAQRATQREWTLPISWSTKEQKKTWWVTLIAQGVGIYFPTRRLIVIGYAFLIVGIMICEFTFVGINLNRTLSCSGELI
jgi:hypothetical protein